MSDRTIVASALLCALTIAATAPSAMAQDVDHLSQQLANPVSSLISVPVQNNFDFGAGADDDGLAFTANVQPVVPIPLNSAWTMISRTIVPIGYRDYLPPPDGDTFGLGDITQSLFFSPAHPGPSGVIWGAGPVFVVPTATDDVLGGGQWGIGPTIVVLKQTGPWTVGALANHVWSFAGDDDREDVSATFLQPFMTYGLGHGRSVALNTETTYDWEHEQWTVPVNLSYSQVFKVGTQMMSGQIGAKYYLDGPDGSPEWGLRATVTWLFPAAH